MSIFFTGDLHFGHENAIKFDNRPFDNVDTMDNELINKWNNKVQPGDIVYILGDMIWKAKNNDAPDLIKRLNGQKILIKGNHDRFLHNSEAKKCLAGIKDYDDISVTLNDGTVKRCILSHWYMPMYNGARYNGVHLFAHFHNSYEHSVAIEIADLLKKKGIRSEAYNVGCMHWNYEPVTLDEILESGKGVIS